MDEKIISILQDIQNHLVKHDARFDNLDARMDKLDTRMDSLESRMDKLDTKIDNLEGRVDKLKTTLKEEIKLIGQELHIAKLKSVR